MARKTYHHLVVGSFVVAERIELADNGLKVVKQYTRARVVENDPKAKTLKLNVSWKEKDVASISKQSGWEWGNDAGDENGCWRIAPAHARTKGSQVHKGDSMPDLPTTLTIARNFDVYPGQPLVSAACIMREYHNPETAALPCISHAGEVLSWYAAEGNGNIPGAGGQTTRAVDALLRFRQHGSIDQVIWELHEGWKQTVGPGTGNHESKFEEGQKKAQELEPQLRKALPDWLSGWNGATNG
jgi:hypothetical protein